MKKTAIAVFALTIFVVSIFLPLSSVYGKEDYSVSVTLRYGDKVWVYSTQSSYAELTQSGAQNRGAFRSLSCKKKIVDDLITQGFTLNQAVSYVLPGFNAFVGQICSQVDKAPVDSVIGYKDGKFSYTQHLCGEKVNVPKLYSLVYKAFANNINLSLPVDSVKPKQTRAQAQIATTLRGGFVTDFLSSGQARSGNIALALSKIDGLVLEPAQTVSFNALVGDRTVANGFSTAKIIVNGKYVDGVGGGVCQVSTTLYNALISSCVQVNRRCKHSLVSSYCMPGFDAMVNSGSADLIFTNNTDRRLYFYAKPVGKTAVVKIYGLPNVYTVKRRNEVLSTLPFNTVEKDDEKGEYADKVTYRDETLVLQHGTNGVTVKAYLDYFKGERLDKTVYMGLFKYLPADRVIVHGSKTRLIQP